MPIILFNIDCSCYVNLYYLIYLYIYSSITQGIVQDLPFKFYSLSKVPKMTFVSDITMFLRNHVLCFIYDDCNEQYLILIVQLHNY